MGDRRGLNLSSTSAAGSGYMSPHPSRPSAVGRVQANEIPEDREGNVPFKFLATDTRALELVTETTSLVSGPPSGCRLRSIESYSWPTSGQQPEPTGFLNPDALVIGRGVTSGASAAKKDERSGTPTNASRGVITGPTRTPKASTQRSRPYGATHPSTRTQGQVRRPCQRCNPPGG